jgi:ribosomal protein S18 acetylase RimI-like enzyme
LHFNIFRPDENLAEELAATNIACWRQAYTAFVPPEILANAKLDEQTARWKRTLSDSTRIVFAASTESNVLAGFIVAGRPKEVLFDGMDGHIAALYILASFHRQGLGRRFLGAAAKEWVARGGNSLALGVLAENRPARRFYESLGAKLVRTGTYEWDGHPLPDAIYVFENLAELSAFTP